MKTVIKTTITLVQVYCTYTICSQTLQALISSHLKLISTFSNIIAITVTAWGYEQCRVHLCLAPWTWAFKYSGMISTHVVKASENLVNCLHMCTHRSVCIPACMFAHTDKLSGICYSTIIYILHFQRNRNSSNIILCEADGVAHKEPKLLPQSTFWASTVKKAGGSNIIIVLL